MKQVDFIIDETFDNSNSNSKIIGISLVIIKECDYGKIPKATEKLELKLGIESSSILHYHYTEDTVSHRHEIINIIPDFPIQSYSSFKIFDTDTKIDNKYVHSELLINLIKPILRKYEKLNYTKVNLKFENLTDKACNDKKFIYNLLSNDSFLSKYLDSSFLSISIITKKDKLTFLPDYILGVILDFLKEKKDTHRKDSSLVIMNMRKVRKIVSRITIIKKSKVIRYDFKKENEFIEFLESK